MRRTLVRASWWRRWLFLFAILLLSAGPATAEADQLAATLPSAEAAPDPSGAVVQISWPEIVQLVEEHPRLAAGRLQVDAARAGVSAAGALPNPTLEGEVGKGFERAGEASRVEWGLELSVPLGWMAQRGARIGAAEAEVDVALAENVALRRDVLLQLRTLFWTLAYQQAAVASLEELEAQTSVLVQLVKKRVETGEGRPVEATRVEIEFEKVASELESARTSLSARQAELALWLAVPAEKALVAVADLQSIPVPVDRQTALSEARKKHPDLAVARARTRSLEAELSAERRARVPSFGVKGFATDELDRSAFGVGLEIDLPLWNWNSGPIARADAQLAAGRKQAQAVALELEASVLEAQASCQASVLSATRFKNNVVPRSESAAATMERTFQLGEASLLEVIDARRTLLDSSRQFLSALAQSQIDCSRLGALIGEDF